MAGTLRKCVVACKASFVALLGCVSHAHAQGHLELMNVYANVASTTLFAEDACPAYRVNRSKLGLVRLQARISSAEESIVEERIRANVASIRSAYARAGQAAWCADTYDLFGPAGSLVPGVLAR